MNRRPLSFVEVQELKIREGTKEMSWFEERDLLTHHADQVRHLFQPKSFAALDPVYLKPLAMIVFAWASGGILMELAGNIIPGMPAFDFSSYCMNAWNELIALLEMAAVKLTACVGIGAGVIEVGKRVIKINMKPRVDK